MHHEGIIPENPKHDEGKDPLSLDRSTPRGACPQIRMLVGQGAVVRPVEVRGSG